MNTNPSKKAREQIRLALVARIKAIGINQNAAAQRMGLTAAQTSRLLSGKGSFTLDRMLDAAKAFRITVRVVS